MGDDRASPVIANSELSENTRRTRRHYPFQPPACTHQLHEFSQEPYQAYSPSASLPNVLSPPPPLTSLHHQRWRGAGGRNPVSSRTRSLKSRGPSSPTNPSAFDSFISSLLIMNHKGKLKWYSVSYFLLQHSKFRPRKEGSLELLSKHWC